MRRLALILALAAPPILALADGSSVTSASTFKLTRGARAAGMAGAYTALADDSLALLYNPAGLTELREVELGASHMEWLDGVRDESVQLGVPLFGKGAWGIGASYLYTSDQGRDNWGTPTGSFNDFDFSAQAAYALQLGDDGAVGLTYKIIREGYETRFNMGSSFDLGLNYKFFNRKFITAFSSSNMGSNLGLGTGYAPQPLTLKGALGLIVSPELSLDLEYEHQPYDFFNKVRLGAEYMRNLGDDRSVAFRLGYLLGPDNASGGLSGFTAGLGGKWSAYRVDYAFVPKGDLGISQFVTLSLGFGQH